MTRKFPSGTPLPFVYGSIFTVSIMGFHLESGVLRRDGVECRNDWEVMGFGVFLDILALT
jgi:hypothetical protein